MNAVVFDSPSMVGRFAFVLAFAALCGPSTALAGPLLGTAEAFAVLGGTEVTNAHVASNPNTTIYGSVGVYAGSSITGFPPATVTGGTTHGPDGVSQQAQADQKKAYQNLAALQVTKNLTGQDLGTLGTPLKPGVYRFDSSAQLTGALTLDFEGNPDALFVFQVVSALTTASSSTVLITNGQPSDGVYWQVGSTATLGADTLFAGNILALTSVILDPRAEILCGRAFAQTAEVTLIDNKISNNCSQESFGSSRNDFGSIGFSGAGLEFDTFGNVVDTTTGTVVAAVVPVPGTLALFGFGLAGLFGFARRR